MKKEKELSYKQIIEPIAIIIVAFLCRNMWVGLYFIISASVGLLIYSIETIRKGKLYKGKISENRYRILVVVSITCFILTITMGVFRYERLKNYYFQNECNQLLKDMANMGDYTLHLLAEDRWPESGLTERDELKVSMLTGVYISEINKENEIWNLVLSYSQLEEESDVRSFKERMKKCGATDIFIQYYEDEGRVKVEAVGTDICYEKTAKE